MSYALVILAVMSLFGAIVLRARQSAKEQSQAQHAAVVPLAVAGPGLPKFNVNYSFVAWGIMFLLLVCVAGPVGALGGFVAMYIMGNLLADGIRS